jgi:hypothetical protein
MTFLLFSFSTISSYYKKNQNKEPDDLVKLRSVGETEDTTFDARNDVMSSPLHLQFSPELHEQEFPNADTPKRQGAELVGISTKRQIFFDQNQPSPSRNFQLFQPALSPSTDKKVDKTFSSVCGSIQDTLQNIDQHVKNMEKNQSNQPHSNPFTKNFGNMVDYMMESLSHADQVKFMVNTMTYYQSFFENN